MPNSTNFIPTAAEYIRILPEIILTIVATFIMVLEGDARRIAADRGNLAPIGYSARVCSQRSGGDVRRAWPAGRRVPADADRRRLRDVLPGARDHRRRFLPSFAPVSTCGASDPKAASITR